MVTGRVQNVPFPPGQERTSGNANLTWDLIDCCLVSASKAPQKFGQPWRGHQVVTGRFATELGHQHGMLRCIDGLVRIHIGVPAQKADQGCPAWSATYHVVPPAETAKGMRSSRPTRPAQLEGSPVELDAKIGRFRQAPGEERKQLLYLGGCRRPSSGRLLRVSLDKTRSN